MLIDGRDTNLDGTPGPEQDRPGVGTPGNPQDLIDQYYQQAFDPTGTLQAIRSSSQGRPMAVLTDNSDFWALRLAQRLWLPDADLLLVFVGSDRLGPASREIFRGRTLVLLSHGETPAREALATFETTGTLPDTRVLGPELGNTGFFHWYEVLPGTE